MYALIKRCLRSDKSPAWGELWLIYDQYVAQPLRRQLVRAGVDPSEADDVAQEIYFALHENRCERLRSFQGHSDRELGAWLAQLAKNFARDWIEQRWRAERRLRKALENKATPTRPAATEEEVTEFIRTLEEDAVVSHDEADQLRQLVGSGDKPGLPASGRTGRRRRAELEDKVRQDLGLPGRRKSRLAKGKRKKS